MNTLNECKNTHHHDRHDPQGMHHNFARVSFHTYIIAEKKGLVKSPFGVYLIVYQKLYLAPSLPAKSTMESQYTKDIIENSEVIKMKKQSSEKNYKPNEAISKTEKLQDSEKESQFY